MRGEVCCKGGGGDLVIIGTRQRAESRDRADTEAGSKDGEEDRVGEVEQGGRRSSRGAPGQCTAAGRSARSARVKSVIIVGGRRCAAPARSCGAARQLAAGAA